MARTQSATSPALSNITGETANIAYGTAGGSGTSTTVTIPHLKQIIAVHCTQHSGTTSIYVGTDTVGVNGGASFTATHGSGVYFDWIAVGKARM